MDTPSQPRPDDRPASPLTIAVAGSTGVVGRHVVAALERDGQRVRHIARSHGVDLLHADQVSDALEGVDAVVDVANVVTTKAGESTEFFARTTSHLVDGCRRQDVGRYVLLSIVGVDKVRSGYYAGKLEQERVLAESGLGHVVLRATQFHEFAAQMWDRMGRGPLVVAPRMRCAPVAAEEVGGRLAEVAVDGSGTTLLEMGGPEVHELPDLMRSWGRATGRRAVVVPVPVPGDGGRAMRDGGLVPDSPDVVGAETFAQWLARTGLAVRRPGTTA